MPIYREWMDRGEFLGECFVDLLDAGLAETPFAAGVFTRAARRAVADHLERTHDEFMRRELQEAKELSRDVNRVYYALVEEYKRNYHWYFHHPDFAIPRTLPWLCVQVERVTCFEDEHHGDIAEIELTYGTRSARAIYGIDAAGRLSLYAD